MPGNRRLVERSARTRRDRDRGPYPSGRRHSMPHAQCSQVESCVDRNGWTIWAPGFGGGTNSVGSRSIEPNSVLLNRATKRRTVRCHVVC